MKKGDRVYYDNFGKVFKGGNQIYTIVAVEEAYGFLISVGSDNPFHAYLYQLQLIQPQ